MENFTRKERGDDRVEEIRGGIWSGLSESNRHLNLGKVPYYHYTKAAQRTSFIALPLAAHKPAREHTCAPFRSMAANSESASLIF
jgi:hypothetical protein